MKTIFADMWFRILSATAIILITTSFIVPPTGVVDNSVIAAVGELFAFAALGVGYKALDKGVKTTVKHKDTELTIHQSDKGQKEESCNGNE